jgi:hypothetical protein
MKVKCVNGFDSNEGEGCVKTGSIYQVETEDDEFYYIKVLSNGSSGGWLKTRFEIVTDSDPNLVTYQHVLDLISQHIKDWKYGAIQDNHNIRALDTNSIVKALQMLYNQLSAEQWRRTSKVDP